MASWTKRLLFSALLLAGGSASAADVTPSVTLLPNWTGFYLGASIGVGGFMRDERIRDPSNAVVFEQDSPTAGEGGIGSVFIGFDRQLGSLVLGGFAEIGTSSQSFELTRPDQHVLLTESRALWLGGRVGWLASPATLLFVSGGYVHTSYDLMVAAPPPGPPPTEPDANSLFLGIGAETIVMPDVSFRIEYRLAQEMGWLAEDIGDGYHFDIRRLSQTGRFALAYRPGSSRGGAVMRGPLPTYSWTGFYLGAGGGYGTFFGDEVDTFAFGSFVNTASYGGRGPLGLVTAGYDLQFLPRWVAGAFAEYDFTNLAYRQSAPTPPPPTLLTSLAQTSAWALGGRIGFTPNPATLWYLAGGYTRAHFASDIFSSPPDLVAGFGDFSGWFAGLGAEARITKHAALRLEYRVSRYDAKVYIVDNTVPVSSTFRPTTQTGRAVLVWRLN